MTGLLSTCFLKFFAYIYIKGIKARDVNMKKQTTVETIQEAHRAGLDVREVSERLDAAVGQPNGLSKWQSWVRKMISRKAELVLGH